MRRRTNTHCQSSDEPKEIDRFKKRHPPRVLFAEQVNYSMTIGPVEGLETASNGSSNEGKSLNGKQKENGEVPFQFVQEEYSMEEKKSKKTDDKVAAKLDGLQSSQETNCQQIENPSNQKQNEKETTHKKSIIIIGENTIYEEKQKGFKKGARRRYSHKNQADYMTY